MSHFVECQTEFRDPQALVAALIACGFEASQIEVHPEPVALYGYQGDAQPQRAHVVIRRRHIGTGANDAGWERQDDGSFRGWISEFDAGVGAYSHRQQSARFNRAMQDKLKREYAFNAVARQQSRLGRTVQRRELETGEIEMVIAGYR